MGVTVFGLDNRSLLLVAGGLYLLLSPSIWLILRMPRNRVPLMWCFGGMMIGCGLVLMALRGRVPDELSYVVGQPMMALGVVMITQSLRLDLGRSWPWWWLVLASGTYAAILWWLLPMASIQTLGVLIRGVNLVTVLILASTAWQVARAESSRNAQLIGYACVLQAAAVMANLVHAGLGSDDIQTLHSSVLSVITSLVLLMVGLMFFMGYLGLALERTTRRRLKLTQEMTRVRQWHEQREALVRRDRERLLGLLADSLGHEILQPLTAALLRVQLGQRQIKAGEPLAVLLPGIEEVVLNIQRARETVERVRHFVRPLPQRNVAVNMLAQLGHVAQLVRQEALNRHLNLRFEQPEEVLWVQADSLQLSQAVLQVVRNAMTAVEKVPHGSILVKLEATAEQVRVKVIDSGPGLPAQVLQEDGRKPGSWPQSLQGIGLFVVQGILLRHHGWLELGNLPDGGAVVTLVLPRYWPATPGSSGTGTTTGQATAEVPVLPGG
jgi:signal transduction histidine kinase